MSSDTNSKRLAKGINLIGLVQLVRHVRKERSLPPLSPEAENLLVERVLPTAWYPHRAFIELIEFTFREVLGGNAKKGYEAGMAGGRIHLQGAHKALLNENDPLASVLAMRHAWRFCFNFGELRAEPTGAKAVTFRLSGYRDVPPGHAYMIAGWGAAGAQLAGMPSARAEVLHGPWQGGAELIYKVEY